MTPRMFRFAISRPRVWVPAALGLWFLLGGVSKVAGIILLAVGFFKAMRLLSHQGVDRRLRLRQDKYQRGIRRKLTRGESREVMAIDAYVDRLRAAGADESLGAEAMAQVWAIIGEHGCDDATHALKRFRQQLPSPTQRRAETQAGLASRIQQELDLLRASRREVESLG